MMCHIIITKQLVSVENLIKFVFNTSHNDMSHMCHTNDCKKRLQKDYKKRLQKIILHRILVILQSLWIPCGIPGGV